LRDRRDDIPLLAQHFLARNRMRYRKQVSGFSPAALQQMLQYPWPGNVRELKNVLERVLILNPQVNRIERRHLPMLVHRRSSKHSEEFSTLQQAREAYEREYILKKIDECHGNMSRAAESLGLERSHLYRKMRTLNINVRE
ncbi:MAG: helix-turn-helix domain-containing protein, partial [Silvibacterium sp.]